MGKITPLKIFKIFKDLEMKFISVAPFIVVCATSFSSITRQKYPHIFDMCKMYLPDSFGYSVIVNTCLLILYWKFHRKILPIISVLGLLFMNVFTLVNIRSSYKLSPHFKEHYFDLGFDVAINIMVITVAFSYFIITLIKENRKNIV